MSDIRTIPTMEEFAKVSGISRPTLSKYFNDPASVRASTRKKIEAALDRYDYTPNVYAINQNRRTTRTIGIIVPNLADPFFTEIGRKVESACIDAGYRPVMLSSHGGPDQELANLDSLLAMKPAGVLLAPFGRISDTDAVRSFSDKLDIVLFDANIEGADLPYYGTDNGQSVDLMVEYLCRSGEPPCFFEMKEPLNPNARKRHTAYVASMERHGHTPRVYRADGKGWDFEEIGFQEGGRMLRDRVFATNTILCSNDRLAIGMLAAAHLQGIKVGLDDGSELRIAGHDDHPFARYTGPRLTTISQDYASIATSAVNHLIDRIGDQPNAGAPQVTEFPGRLIMRESA